MRPARKRKLVDTIKADWKVSIRRACAVLKIDRSLYVYKSKRSEQAELKLKIRDIYMPDTGAVWLPSCSHPAEA